LSFVSSKQTFLLCFSDFNRIFSCASIPIIVLLLFHLHCSLFFFASTVFRKKKSHVWSYYIYGGHSGGVDDAARFSTCCCTYTSTCSTMHAKRQQDVAAVLLHLHAHHRLGHQLLQRQRPVLLLPQPEKERHARQRRRPAAVAHLQPTKIVGQLLSTQSKQSTTPNIRCKKIVLSFL